MFHSFPCGCRKHRTEEEILAIDVKAGWEKGTKITFTGKGNREPNVKPADVVFIVVEKVHRVYTRVGNDLVVTKTISLLEALTGYTVNLVTLDGRNLTVPINEIIHPGYVKVLQGEGMPFVDETKKGNLKIKFEVIFPAKLTFDQKVGIKKLLGP